MLSEIIKNSENGKKLVIDKNYKIYPDIDDRKFWEKAKNNSFDFFNYMCGIYGTLPREHLTATLYLKYINEGDRSEFENIYFLRRNELIIKTCLECMCNDGKYMEDIVNLTWMILEESTWCVPAHEVWVEKADKLPDFNEQTLDLFSAETAHIMSFVYQTIGKKLDEYSTVIKRRIKDRINRFILDCYLNRSDYWWMGFTGEMMNNWCVWINSNILSSAIILADSEEKLRNIFDKFIKSINIYINARPLDGACDEGPTYWTQAGLSLLEDLWLLKMLSGGEYDFFGEEKIKNTLRFFMNTYTGDGRWINYADGGTKPPVFYPSLYKYASLTDDNEVKCFAKLLSEKTPLFNIDDMDIRRGLGIINRVLRMYDLMEYKDKLTDFSAECEFKTDCWLESINVLTSKSDADPENGLYFSIKGGHNDESHNHNDVGHFIVYKNGEKFLIDIGSMLYSKITFSDKRYTLFTTRSSYHNVPFINGCEQKYGREYSSKDVSYKNENNITSLSLDISEAYENKSEIKKWVRTFSHDKNTKKIIAVEDFLFEKEMEYELHFVTPCLVESTPFGIVLTSKNNEKLNIDFDNKKLDAVIDYIDIEDVFLKRDWGERIYRICLKSKAKEDKINYAIY